MTDYVSSGSDFIVNSFTGSHQDQPRIAHFSNGNYVVVWKSIDGETSDSVTLKAQIFDPNGNRIGAEFVVESHGGGMQLNPNVAVLADDSFVVTWQSEDSAYYGSTSTIAAQRFSATGALIGGEFAVNSSATPFPTAPAITSLANGGYVITWDDFLNHAVRARVFAADGSPVGSEFVIGTYNGSSATSHTVQALAGGGFAAVWNAPDGSSSGVRVQLFTATGAEASGEFWANSQTADNQYGVNVVALAGGNFVVLWTSYNTAQDGSFSAIKAQMFSASGTAIGGEFLVNQLGTGYQVAPRATALADGGFIVGWQSSVGASNGYDNTVRARVFDANGNATGNEFQVDGANFTQTSYLGGLTTLADGSVRLVYSTWGGDGDGDGVLLRTLVPQSATQTAPTIVSNGGGATAAVSVAEYSLNVTSFRAIDPDGPQATTFAITGGSDATRFSIDATTGRLSFVYSQQFANPGDANGDNVYEVVVTASDGTLSDSQTLQVSVFDIDESITFSGSTQFQVDENQQAAGVATATSAAPMPIYYSITGGADASLLTIDSFTGALSFVSAPDYENPADADGDGIYEVEVMATSGYADSIATVTVQVLDVNETGGPEFLSPSTLDVAENGQFVVTVEAVSPDDYFYYSITGGADAAQFGIDTYTGQLYFLSAPDYEFSNDANFDNVYEVEVTAWGQVAGQVGTQTVSITVTNVLEEPVIYSDNHVAMDENLHTALQLQVYNPEGNPVSFSIVTVPEDVSDAALFTIDPNTGELAFLIAPNYEIPGDFNADNTYEVIVAATDVITGIVGMQRVYVHVGDVADYPLLTSANAFTVAENSAAVATLTASHPVTCSPEM